MRRSLLGVVIGAIALLFVANQCFFFVGENQRGLVLQLGEPLQPVRQPGLNFKLPFIQNVLLLDNRIMLFNIPRTTSMTSDQKNLEVDSYACWRITDFETYVKKLRSEAEAADRLRTIVNSRLQGAIGSRELIEVVNTRRAEIMDDVLRSVNKEAEGLGVEVVDVRIKRTELPNRLSIFERMKAERTRMANKYRYEGESENRRIRSEAERDRDRILAEARRESLIIQGKGDAEAMGIFNSAIAASPEFYEFSKSLELYRKSFKEKSQIILSTDDPLLQYLK